MDNLEKIVNKHLQKTGILPTQEKYIWRRRQNGYIVELPNGDKQELYFRLDKWLMIVILNGKHYQAEQEYLEEAFKACDSLLYSENKELWRKIDAHTVLMEFEDTEFDLDF